MHLTLITDRLDRWHVAQLRGAARRAGVRLRQTSPQAYVSGRDPDTGPGDAVLLLINSKMSPVRRAALAERLRRKAVINRPVLVRTALADPVATIEEVSLRGGIGASRRRAPPRTAPRVRLLCIGGHVTAAASRSGHAAPWEPVSAVSASAKRFHADALDAVSLFELPFAAVEFAVTSGGKPTLIAVDPAPDWRAFQPRGSMRIAENLIALCIGYSQRGTHPWPALVQQSYERALPELGKQAFHYASRLWLWTRDARYRSILETLRASYLGADDAAIAAQMRSILRHEEMGLTSLAPWKHARIPFFRRYRLLARANKLLFISLFSELIYSYDVRPILRELLPDAELLALRKRLLADAPAMTTLSTRAVNFLWLTDHYFRPTPGRCPPLDPRIFLRRAATIDAASSTARLWSHNYLLLHAIIGASRFYTRRITEHRPVYVEALRRVERAIGERYFDVTLDQKFEFLVCAELLGEEVSLRRIILQEAAHSFARTGNYLVDALRHPGASVDRNLRSGEHRNVLAVMATIPWALASPGQKRHGKKPGR